MSTDKRTVHTDALDSLGTLIDENAKRDAIHLAVEPVIAGEDLKRGQDVCVRGGKAWVSGSKPVGIIDPFLNVPEVMKGQRCWVVVYPRTITSLRHVWEHPDFDSLEHKDKEQRMKESEKWLKDFCNSTDCPPFQDIIQKVLDNETDDEYASEYMHFSGQDASGEIPDEFWKHVEIVTGMTFNNKPKYFSCSC